MRTAGRARTENGWFGGSDKWLLLYVFVPTTGCGACNQLGDALPNCDLCTTVHRFGVTAKVDFDFTITVTVASKLTKLASEYKYKFNWEKFVGLGEGGTSKIGADLDLRRT